jgi:hypothetical protein
MSDSIHSHPFSAVGRQNYDRIFRRKPRPWDDVSDTDPVHSLTPGTIREYRSDCCGVEVECEPTHYVCAKCGKACNRTLTKIN